MDFIFGIAIIINEIFQDYSHTKKNPVKFLQNGYGSHYLFSDNLNTEKIRTVHRKYLFHCWKDADKSS